MSNPKDLLGKTVMYRNKVWQVVGVTVNAFGIFLQLENGSKKATARMEEVEI
jgi:hypothetical protein